MPAPAHIAVAVVVCAAIAGLAAPVLAGRVPDGRAEADASRGSPAAGRLVFLSSGCGGCHALVAGGSPTTGPALTKEALAARAADAGKKLGPFVAESIVAPDVDVAAGYTSGVMRAFTEIRGRQLDDLVSYLIGQSYTGGVATPTLPANPVKACDARPACRAMVARWSRVNALPVAALPGAKVVAVSGCLGCHSYAGSGAKRGAPDLTRVGRRLGAARLLKQLRCPSCVRADTGMPSFAALGSANLQRVVAFLRASRGGAK